MEIEDLDPQAEEYLASGNLTDNQKRYYNEELTLLYIAGLPTIESLHFENLKVSLPDVRVLLSRMTVGDGAPYNHQVSVEFLIDGNWVTVKEYQAL